MDCFDFESKQGMNVRSNIIMLAITLGIFAFSTAYWAVSVASLVSKITQEHVHRNTVIRQIFNAVVLTNCKAVPSLYSMNVYGSDR